MEKIGAPVSVLPSLATQVYIKQCFDDRNDGSLTDWVIQNDTEAEPVASNEKVTERVSPSEPLAKSDGRPGRNEHALTRAQYIEQLREEYSDAQQEDRRLARSLRREGGRAWLARCRSELAKSSETEQAEDDSAGPFRLDIYSSGAESIQVDSTAWLGHSGNRIPRCSQVRLRAVDTAALIRSGV